MNETKNNLTELPNIGKVTAQQLEQIGIHTKEEFLKRDPYEIFEELLEKVDPTLCRSCLAGIVGASKNTVWHKVSKESAEQFQKLHPDHKWKS